MVQGLGSWETYILNTLVNDGLVLHLILRAPLLSCESVAISFFFPSSSFPRVDDAVNDGLEVSLTGTRPIFEAATGMKDSRIDAWVGLHFLLIKSDQRITQKRCAFAGTADTSQMVTRLFDGFLVVVE